MVSKYIPRRSGADVIALVCLNEQRSISKEAMSRLVELGLAQYVGEDYEPTDKGVAVYRMLLSIRDPEKQVKWIAPDGTEL